jgi:DNA-binding MarR family transcriptional regulator
VSQAVDLDTAVGYVLKRASTALRTAMDADLRILGLTVPQYSCMEQLAHRPGLTNAELARGTFVSRQAMHRLISGLRSASLITGDGAGRHEHYTLTASGRDRLTDASSAVAVTQDRMLAPFDEPARRRLYLDLVTCAEALEPH